MDAPFNALSLTVPKTWIDINGHMNATHYGLVVYDAHVMFTEAIGLGEQYVRENQCGKAVLESHIVYEREVCEGDELQVLSWLLAVDKKRLHFFHEVYNRTKNFRAATAEQLDIHIDLQQRKSAEMPENIYLNLKKIVSQHMALPQPSGVGSRIRPPQSIGL